MMNTMNTIRADFYRISRGKALYVTMAVLLSFVALLVLTDMEVMVGINTDVIDMDVAATNGMTAARQMLTRMDSLIFMLVPLFIIVATAMFSCGSVKNEISIGMSRGKLYAAKLALSSVLCVVFMAVYMISGILSVAAFRGIGNWTAGFFATVLKAFGAQAVILLACNAIGVFLSFATRRTAAVIGIYIAVIYVPAMVLTLLAERFTSLAGLYKYDITYCLKFFSYIDMMTGADIVRGLAVGAVYIIASTVAGVALFRRAEIK